MAFRLRRPSLLVALLAASGCARTGGDPLGPADSLRIFAHAGGESPHRLPLFRELPLTDPRAFALQQLFADGFAAEMMRTTYLAKQLVREGRAGAMRYPAAARAAAGEPTVLLAGEEAVEGNGFALPPTLFGRPQERPGTPWIGLPPGFDRDQALVETVAGRLAAHVASMVAPEGEGAPGGPPARALARGYAQAMEVIAREWRQGEGKGLLGLLPRQAGTAEQRERFARVRENRYVIDRLRSGTGAAADLLADPGVAATVLYRMAQARGIGRRVGPAEIYAPFSQGRLPPGVSPAAVLGPFRNFQAKLLGVWGRAFLLRGAPPRDIAELVSDYARELPAERSEAIRIFVITTYGATIRPGGVSTEPGDADKILPELTALAAEAAAGKVPLAPPMIKSPR